MKSNLHNKLTGLGWIGLVALISAIAGCATPEKTAQTEPLPEAAVASKGGAQLWSENCTRCHYGRSPASYSDAQWEVAMIHMRTSANLTADEHHQILEFLQSAN